LSGHANPSILIKSTLTPVVDEEHAMPPPSEKLFRLEIEFRPHLRAQAPGTADATALHAGSALQVAHGPLIRAVDTTTAPGIGRLRARLALAGDARDILAACDSRGQMGS
jgi:hypothetical protein